MDVLATGRTQASRVLINKYVVIVRDTVRANSEQFRGNGIKFYDLLN
jgi:DNA replication licensing factor MCM4